MNETVLRILPPHPDPICPLIPHIMDFTTKNCELLNCTFVMLGVGVGKTCFGTICKAVINVSHCFSRLKELSLCVLQTCQMCLLFLHHELRGFK